jgi:hypothetical protein
VDSGPPLTFALAVINICSMIPVAALAIGLYLSTPRTGKGIAIYGAIASTADRFSRMKFKVAHQRAAGERM